MNRLPVVTSEKGRAFSCFPAAVLVIVVNSAGDVLRFSKSPGKWGVVSGAVEAARVKLIVPQHRSWILSRAVEYAARFEAEDAPLEYFVNGSQ